MTEVDHKVPMKYKEKADSIIDSVRLYLIKRWHNSIYDGLKSGYKEMSQINLTLAEMGLEQDVEDLITYETKLGCGKL